jgi:hypothetical protein
MCDRNCFGSLIGIIIKKKYVIIYCFTETKEESPKNTFKWDIIGFVVVFFLIFVIGIGCLVKYRKLKNFLYCNLHYAKQGETNVMISPSP